MELSERWPLTDMMWRASKPDLSKIVTAVARIEWFVYCCDKPACLDMFFIMSPRYSIFRRRPCCHTKHQNLPSYSSLDVETRIHSVGLNAVDISQKMQQDRRGLRLHTSSLLVRLRRFLCDFFLARPQLNQAFSPMHRP